MATICTSCGISIPSSLNIYKCRQCINHFVCQVCVAKDHHRAGAALHTFDEVFLKDIQSINDVNTHTSSEFADFSSQRQIKTLSNSLSIFYNEGYLYSLLGYCYHCYSIIVADKEPTFQCQQCPNFFEVCIQCIILMDTQHSSTHTFLKQSLSYWKNIAHNMYHLDIICDGCSRIGFNGKRYQCEECSPNYDLCENCFGKVHTHHKLKYIQNPLLHSLNQETLSRRTLALAERNGKNNRNRRDSLTGWTKSDAELVIQQAKQEKDNYNNRLQRIRAQNSADHTEYTRHLQNTVADNYQQFNWNYMSLW
ncbi:unnamed protein product [Adineta ricciae]|uniref:ZZ-type domain-containing protein n=1 Tax=Adineta ricciae TaxID=249248 RepID=A0A815RXG6_ADIRI|nr:unnamed protein product [Adineta ricciae]